MVSLRGLCPIQSLPGPRAACAALSSKAWGAGGGKRNMALGLLMRLSWKFHGILMRLSDSDAIFMGCFNDIYLILMRFSWDFHGIWTRYIWFSCNVHCMRFSCDVHVVWWRLYWWLSNQTWRVARKSPIFLNANWNGRESNFTYL